MGKGSGGCDRPALAIAATGLSTVEIEAAPAWEAEYKNPLSTYAGPTTLATTTLLDDDPAVVDARKYPRQHNSKKLNYKLITDSADLSAVADALDDEAVTRIALDIETTGGLMPWEGSIRLIQLGVEEPEPRQFLIDAWACDPAPILAVLSNPKKEIVMCNGRYEQQHLLYRYGTVISNPYDVMYASQVITKSRNRSMANNYKALMYRYIGKRISKEQQTSRWEQSQLSMDQLRYAALDVAGLMDIRRRLGLDVAQRGLRATVRGKFYGIYPTARKILAQNARHRSDQADRVIRAIRHAHTREEADRYRSLVPRLPLTFEQVEEIDRYYTARLLEL